MSISDELEKLAELRREGVLSDDEFEIAKQKVLHGESDTSANEQLEDIKNQNEIAQLDRQWDIEREKLMTYSEHGHRRVPSKNGSLIGGVVFCGFGLFMMTITPAIGLIAIVLGVGASAFSFFKAGKYQAAEQNYKRRRDALIKKG